MSAEHDEHGSLIKTPKQLIVVVVLSFVVPITAFILLSQLVTTGATVSSTSTAMSAAAIAERLKPVGEMGAIADPNASKVEKTGVGEIGAIADPNASKVEKTGEEIVKTACAACHATGAMNAPKLSDKGAWAPRIATGLDKLVANASNGIRQMPARGGNPGLSNSEIARAVVYMTNQSGANFKEPQK